MSPRLVTLSLALGAGALGSCGASGVHSASSGSANTLKRPCQPSGARTVAANRQARIYTVRGVVYGCSQRTGKRVRLGHAGGCIGTERAAPLALAGELAGYGLERCGVDTGFSQVVVRRLSDGATLRNLPATTGTTGPESYVTVGSLVLKASGAVAWIASGGSIVARSKLREVRRADRIGSAVLDSGAAIDPGSLRLHGSRLTWKRGTATRSGRLS